MSKVNLLAIKLVLKQLRLFEVLRVYYDRIKTVEDSELGSQLEVTLALKVEE